METISNKKRAFLYLINILVYLGLGFAGGSPFFLWLKLGLAWYIVISLGFAIVLAVLIRYLLIRIMRGYTIISYLFGVQYIGLEKNKLKKRQIIIRVFNEAVVFLLLLDLIYLKMNHTERGVIDRISDSFIIDLRRE